MSQKESNIMSKLHKTFIPNHAATEMTQSFFGKEQKYLRKIKL
jgi:hypothetical protein